MDTSTKDTSTETSTAAVISNSDRPLAHDEVLAAPVSWKPTQDSGQSVSPSDPSTWMPLVFKVPVFGWALECVMDDRVEVRVAGLSVFVMSALIALLMLGKPGWVIPLALVSGMLISAYRIMR
ncbi:MAG: hypothetical protein AAFV45_05530 [Pseudomonadota bacterium]